MQWHQLDHMQTVCTSLQTDNHTNTLSLDFYRPDALLDAEPTVLKHWRAVSTVISCVLFANLFRTCRTSSFCTVAWQLARFQLTRRIAWSLGDIWASCFSFDRADWQSWVHIPFAHLRTQYLIVVHSLQYGSAAIYFFSFLSHDAMLAGYLLSSCICPSVCHKLVLC